MNYQEKRDSLKQLAFIDEADDYEVDEAGIYLNEQTGQFHLLTASGCSCWDGEFDEEIFDSLDQLESSLINNDRSYNPSLNGANRLINEAKESLLLKAQSETSVSVH